MSRAIASEAPLPTAPREAGPARGAGRLDPLDSLEANWQHRHCTGKFSVWPGPSRWLMVLEATTLLPGVTAW
jgi:hypothetical protein